MKKNTNLCVDLKTVMQEVALLIIGQSYNGVLTRKDEDRYLFEEEVKRQNGSHYRNPKLFDGKYVSLTRLQNGRYQLHSRTIEANSDIDRQQLALNIFGEIVEALAIID